MTVFDHLPAHERPDLLRFCGYTATLSEAEYVVFGALLIQLAPFAQVHVLHLQK